MGLSSLCCKMPCSRSGAAAFALTVLRSKALEVASKVIFAVALAAVSYYNPIHGLALLAGAYIVWTKVMPPIARCVFQYLANKSIELTGDKSKPNDPATILKNAAERLGAVPQAISDDCRYYKFELSERVCYCGKDRQGKEFYVFQLYFRTEGEADRTHLEKIYREADHGWRVWDQDGHWHEPEFFAKARGWEIMPERLQLLQAEDGLFKGPVQIQNGRLKYTVSLSPLPPLSV